MIDPVASFGNLHGRQRRIKEKLGIAEYDHDHADVSILAKEKANIFDMQ